MTFYYVLNRKGETFKVCLSYQEAYLYSQTLRSRVSIIPVIENDASTSHIHSETKKPTGVNPLIEVLQGEAFSLHVHNGVLILVNQLIQVKPVDALAKLKRLLLCSLLISLRLL
jgi:hypothetical protein